MIGSENSIRFYHVDFVGVNNNNEVKCLADRLLVLSWVVTDLSGQMMVPCQVTTQGWRDIHIVMRF